MRVAKTKTLISFMVTAKLICVFGLAYADCWFSHGLALMLKIPVMAKLDGYYKVTLAMSLCHCMLF